MCFTYPMNMTGLPAAAVPVGLSKEGLPISMQIIGPRFGDLKVLQACKVYEDLAPWHQRKPPNS
jgi:aspartyl-tRNA(Asn)/glutamyl-tRNA(Gln) amidotransferase subunit A